MTVVMVVTIGSLSSRSRDKVYSVATMERRRMSECEVADSVLRPRWVGCRGLSVEPWESRWA